MTEPIDVSIDDGTPRARLRRTSTNESMGLVRPSFVVLYSGGWRFSFARYRYSAKLRTYVDRKGLLMFENRLFLCKLFSSREVALRLMAPSG
jgi:hypothetical protein